jgi:hypothetical protein
MRVSGEMDEKRGEWKGAAQVYGNLSELQLTLGGVLDAVADAGRALDHADRSGDAFMRMANRTTLADVLHQQGETAEALERFAEALERFAEAEAMQAEDQRQYPPLYSLPGFRYCDLLLAEAERAAWGALRAPGDRGPARRWRGGRGRRWSGRKQQPIPPHHRPRPPHPSPLRPLRRPPGRPPPGRGGPRPRPGSPSTACAPPASKTTSPAAIWPAL